ncbi:MAG: RlmE family RNA methyltransferase [Thermoplasmatales archaeon]|nr:MAG: RlmE family RNA methyltransferase [Thermoplasmatales archaeon]
MTRWFSEKKKEHFYKEAKRAGYRARSAYKLKQIQKKFRIIKNGDIVLDLGAAPGGWSQIAKEFVGEQGQVIGIDLSPIEPIDGITFLEGDLTEDSSIQKIKNIVGEKKIDVILSDMSPNISGNYSIDHATSIYLCERALKTTEILLKSEGIFVCKAFTGSDLQDFIKKTHQKFEKVKCFSPVASRKSSSETYIIARYFKKDKY